MLTSASTFASAPVPRASFVDHVHAPAMAFIDKFDVSNYADLEIVNFLFNYTLVVIL